MNIYVSESYLNENLPMVIKKTKPKFKMTGKQKLAWGALAASGVIGVGGAVKSGLDRYKKEKKQKERQMKKLKSRKD